MSSARLEIPTSGRIALRIPFAPANRYWIKEVCGIRSRPEWIREAMPYSETLNYWSIARAQQEVVIHACAERFGSVTVVRQVSERTICDTRCVDAVGVDCVCSCGGLNHGGSEASYARVGTTTLVQRGESSWRVSRFLALPAADAS